MQQQSLLATKLHIPPIRSELVSRPRLIERLNAGLPTRDGFARALTLVSAPAGFRKITLISEPVEPSRPDKISIHIADSGCGIPEENLSHIFDPFYTSKPDGTGLGLSIVYGITKNHKGKIKVNSNIGEGSSFVLTFPVL